MARQYRTREGDNLDWVVWKVYGHQTGQIVETVLAANRHLAELGPTLPGGLLIDLPDLITPEKTQSVRLWG